MTSLSKTEVTQPWLRQFRADDQALATDLLDELVLVSSNDFMRGLDELISKRTQKASGAFGLYAEREIHHHHGVPDRLFKELRGARRRASGSGPKAVQPSGMRSEVGSEGIIAAVITNACRPNRPRLLNHPGPDAIRKRKVRVFAIVTDFIGSGERIRSYLSSAWRVASIRSWWSLKLIRFEVLAYSATDEGKAAVMAHRSKPSVHLVVGCPTVDTAFGSKTDSIRTLCMSYDPIGSDSKESLGFNGSGSLMVFAHGCPNNVPRIFHKGGKGWKPLFTNRATSSMQTLFSENRQTESIEKRLASLRQHGLARGGWIKRTTGEGRRMILLLAALRSAPRFDEAVSRKTGLTIAEIQTYVGKAISWGWLTPQRYVSNAGLAQLQHARKMSHVGRLPKRADAPYYPKSLRAPQKSI